MALAQCAAGYSGRSGLRAGALLLLGLALLLLAAPRDARAQSETTIQVEGNQRIDAATIRSYFHAAPRGAPDAEELDAALKALYATRLFESVRTRQAGTGLVVSVVENPVIRRVAFEGNRKLKDDALKREIESTAGGPLWRPIVQQDVARIVEAYRRSGYFDATVDPKVINGSEGQVELVFEIKESNRIGIARIEFVGDKAYGS
jgi:outer membrane protein insertion porin family